MNRSKYLLLMLLMFQLTSPSFGQSERSDKDLLFAYSQHEIISLLMADGKYSQVLEEFRKILALEFEGDEEKLLVKSAWQIVEGLRQARQFGIAHAIVEETLEITDQAENQFALLMLKAKVFQDEGRRNEAIQTYRKAQQLSVQD
jgi:tetratricopeptide (TPR) repeat protein